MNTGIKGMLYGAAAALVVAGSAPMALAASCGDVNNDGSVAINDVSVHLRVVSGLDPSAAICNGTGYNGCANLNGDAAGDTDINDTDLLLQRVSGVKACPSDQCLAKVVHPGGDLPNTITGNYQVLANATIKGITFIEPGAVLTIAPGVILKGIVQTPPSILVVKPGARINAVGTAVSPITITSNNSVGARNIADIGGLALLGRAPVNESNAFLEGLTPTPDLEYGGTDVNDFSGCLSYTRVQFSGRNLSLDNELNTIVLAGVGRTTRLDHIQAHFGFDDCIEFFGGTVNSKFMVASACGDDGFDTQLGTRGGMQFGLMAQRLQQVLPAGSNGLENDNSEFGFQNGPPFNHPNYCNLTVIGIRGQGAAAPATNSVGLLSRRGNSISVNNSIIKNFTSTGYQMRDGATTFHACRLPGPVLNTAATTNANCTGPGTPRQCCTGVGTGQCPVTTIQSVLFNNNGNALVQNSDCTGGGAPAACCSGVGTGTCGEVAASNDATCDGAAPDDADCQCTTTQHFALLAASNVINTTNASIDAIGEPYVDGTGPGSGPQNLVPAGGSLAATHPSINCTTIDSSFVNAAYIGAFQPGGTDWTAGWTEYPVN